MGKLFGQGALVDAVSPDGIAARYDIKPGDRILAIDGEEPSDLIDYQLLTAYDEFTLTVQRGDEQFDIEVDNEEYQPLGIRFPSAAFDGVHICDNHCTFCFLKQGIPGLRQTMYIKDDDYRLSFLYGNFITLTNLKDDDFERIGAERLSPLHGSVHATNPVVRERLVRSTNGRGGKIMEDLRRLATMDIQFNTQLVLVPEVNDGAELDRSIADLLTLMDERHIRPALIRDGAMPADERGGVQQQPAAGGDLTREGPPTLEKQPRAAFGMCEHHPMPPTAKGIGGIVELIDG